MRRILPALLFAALLVPALGAPNIILILTDDQGWSQTSGLMDPRVKESKSGYLETPNMVRLANAGMRFTSGYSPAPLCTPTRRSIQCGTTTARSGTEFKSPWVPADHLTIPKALKAADPDYRCAHFGKWGEQMISTPEQCGYDASDGMTGNNTGGMPSSLGVKGGHNDGPPHFIDNEDPKRTPSVTTNAIEFMRKQHGEKKPFYVQASYYATHLSVVCMEKTLKKYEKKGVPDRGYPQAWAAMMEELDAGVGRILDAVDEMGIADNTYIFFTADNGGRGSVPGGNASRSATNHPLDGAKHSLLEGGIRVPFIVRGPGIKPKSACHTPVAGYDFLPTFHALAGGKGDVITKEVDGTDFSPTLENPKAAIKRPDDALYFHRPGKKMSAIRQGNFKLLLIWGPDGKVGTRFLCPVGKDPREERRDVASVNPDKADALQKLLLAHLEKVKAEKPGAPKKKKKRKK